MSSTDFAILSFEVSWI